MMNFERIGFFSKSKYSKTASNFLETKSNKLGQKRRNETSYAELKDKNSIKVFLFSRYIIKR